MVVPTPTVTERSQWQLELVEPCYSRFMPPSAATFGWHKESQPEGNNTLRLTTDGQYSGTRVISIPGRRLFVLYDLGQGEHLRADLQTGSIRSKQVDFKMKLVSFGHQVDDPAPDREPFAFANRQSA